MAGVQVTGEQTNLETQIPETVPKNMEFTTPEDLTNLAKRLDDQVKELKSLSVDVKKALNNCSKLSKNGAFLKKKKKVKDPNAPPRAPTGFAKPTKVSKDLQIFLGLQDGEEIARTDVTKRITAYVKENNLQNPENRQELILDEKLSKLLNPPSGENVTYFTLQRFMKPHYIKS